MPFFATALLLSPVSLLLSSSSIFGFSSTKRAKKCTSPPFTPSSCSRWPCPRCCCNGGCWCRNSCGGNSNFLLRSAESPLCYGICCKAKCAAVSVAFLLERARSMDSLSRRSLSWRTIRAWVLANRGERGEKESNVSFEGKSLVKEHYASIEKMHSKCWNQIVIGLHRRILRIRAFLFSCVHFLFPILFTFRGGNVHFRCSQSLFFSPFGMRL